MELVVEEYDSPDGAAQPAPPPALKGQPAPRKPVIPKGPKIET